MNITQRAYHHVEESSQLHSFLCNQNGLDIATLHRVTPDQVSDSDHKVACLDDEGWRATVNLVAAAPELLRTCTELLKRARQLQSVAQRIDRVIPDSRLDLDLDIEEAEAVIRKATLP